MASPLEEWDSLEITQIRKGETMARLNYEPDDKTFDADAYRVDRSDGVAWHVLGWETEPDEDTEWSGYEVRTGQVVCIMIGDDHHFAIDPEEIHPIDREEYCGGCGQMGCEHDGYDRG